MFWLSGNTLRILKVYSGLTTTLSKNDGLSSALCLFSLMKLGQEKYNELVKKEPLYGRLICRCEKVSEAQIIDAIHRNVGATTIKGVKKRVRPGFGKCQGTFCEELVLNIIARELKLPLEDIKYSTNDNNVLLSSKKGQ